MDIKVSNELKLVLELVKKDIDLDKVSEIVSGELDWFGFLYDTLRHGVVALVYSAAKRLAASSEEDLAGEEDEREGKGKTLRIPPWVLRELKKYYDDCAEYALKNSLELLNIKALYRKNKIRYFVVKGMPLALELYGDISLRESMDMDLFVCEEDFENAVTLLLACGYEAQGENDRFIYENRFDEEIKRKYHHLRFYNVSKDTVVELHWKFESKKRFIPLSDFGDFFDFEKLWENRRVINCFDREINCFSLEEEFLFLIYHGTKHYYAKLKWLLDIYYILAYKGEQLNWKIIEEKAKKSGLYWYLLYTLELCKVFFGIEVVIETKAAFGQIRKDILYFITNLVINIDDRMFMPEKRNLIYRVWRKVIMIIYYRNLRQDMLEFI